MTAQLPFTSSGHVSPSLLDARDEAHLVNGVVHPGDWVRELPALHHIQPCACCLCGPARLPQRVDRIGAMGGQTFLVFEDEYVCPADEVERADLATQDLLDWQ
jgi:hypothetical protein